MTQKLLIGRRSCLRFIDVILKLGFKLNINDILNAESIKHVVQEYRLRKGAWIEKYVVMEQEPDYIFVVNKERIKVLTDQLE